jgi:hypothetical protein
VLSQCLGGRQPSNTDTHTHDDMSHIPSRVRMGQVGACKGRLEMNPDIGHGSNVTWDREVAIEFDADLLS